MHEPSTDRVHSEKIAAVLRGEITSGALSPGTWLRQDDLAGRFGTSRVPVREAIGILHVQGLVQILPNRGARVPQLDPSEFDVVYRMRERLEPLTLSESVQNLTPADISHIQEVADRLADTASVETFLALDRDFHLATYRACGSQLLLDETEKLWDATQHHRREFMLRTGALRRPVVDAEHCLILDAVIRGDADGAGVMLAAHIRRTRLELREA